MMATLWRMSIISGCIIIIIMIIVTIIESLELSPTSVNQRNENNDDDGGGGNNNRRRRLGQIYCDLNRMCLCQNYTAQYMDVTCVNVPFDSLPDLSRMMNNESNTFGPHLYRVRIHGARQLTRLNDRNSFARLITLASLSITNTRLSYVDGNVFRDLAISRTLTTLDLSYGQLVDIPIEALDHLEQLQWLSLKGNQIEVIKHRPLHRLQKLRTLLLNENRLFIIDDGSFSQLTSLEQIDFDSNMIERVEGNPFPPSLRSLSISNCLLRKIPFDAIEPLAKLEMLQLQGNLIAHLSPFKLSVRRIQLIDLSHNLIGQLPDNLFANFQSPNRIADQNLKRNENNSTRFTTGHLGKYSSWNNDVDDSRTNLNESIDVDEELRIEQLYLDFNFIQSLGPDLFRSIRLDKLSISNNRLSSAGLSHTATFDGPTARSLKVLDVNYNLIDKYPIAFRELIGLRQLLMKNNRIQTIDPPDAFGASSKTLEVLDLSQNLIEQMPTAAFNTLRNLVKLNLHDNAISRLDSDDLVGWCGPRLKSLTLSKNNLVYLSADAFRACRQLNELRLGGNRLLQIQPVQLAQYMNRLQFLDLSSLANVDWTDTNTSETKFSHVKWLQFDFNELRWIPSHLIHLFPGIKHLDLQNNHIDSIAANRLSEAKHLQSVIVSYNHLTRIHRDSFARLAKLESLTLYFNRIERLDSGAFNELPRLQSLVLSRNQINYIEPGTFVNMANESNSLTLLLDGNRLECLSIDPFLQIRQPAAFSTNDANDDDNNVGDGDDGDQFALYLNVSNNQIKTLANCQNSAITTTNNINSNNNKNWANTAHHHHHHHRNQREQTLAVRVLDLSANQIEQLRPRFLKQFCGKTLSMLANHNLIRRLPLHLFGVGYCAQLQSLSLNHNYIVDLQLDPDDDDGDDVDDDNKTLTTTVDNNNNSRKASFVIQTLSLQHNLIKDLARFYRLFVRCSRLKSLHLNDNQIQWIPANLWDRTSIVTLNLANNRLTLDDDKGQSPIDRCFGIGTTLKYLDLSNNLLRTLPERIVYCDNLNELILSNNQIQSFDYATAIGTLKAARLISHLQRLDLDHNPLNIHVNGRKTFDWLSTDSPSLSVLRLSHVNNMATSLDELNLGELNLPYLHTLDLSGNNISHIASRLLSRSRNVRQLNLAINQLREVPKHIWKYVTRLQWLSLRNNPIDILDSLSFAGLKYLRHLDIRGLNLQYIDSRIFIYQSQILSLKISTYPQIRSFRLQDILSKCDSLQTIVVDVREPTLSHQIQWAFGGKLRELVITGHNLAVIVPDAFQGLNNANDLIVRITNTSVRHLPDSLLRYLADIRYITIDLRGNLLRTVSPSVFFTNIDNYRHSWKTWQSRQLLGGIILENNPLVCDCNLLWISQWMREVFTEMKSINVEAAIHAKAKLSLSRCARPSCYHHPERQQQQSSSKNVVLSNITSISSSVSIIDLRNEDLCNQNCQQEAMTVWQRSSSSSSSFHHYINSIFVLSITFRVMFIVAIH
ncbi:uncharacterized protein LOC124497221 [Dermatophagoides farinae]|uniref:uncharacterized protein LOC124497221 n=1 Tax=Dermatophagoides farinae TaxID=6954 RepID=UPI003F5F5152